MKKTLALVLALVMALALVACGSAQKDLAFTTGGDQGTYYAFGGVMAQKISETTKTKVTAITSGGSKANIEALQAKDAQFGFVQSDVMAYAYGGTRLFEKAVTDFSTVAAMYMEQVQIVTLDPAIEQEIMNSVKQTETGAYLTLDPERTRAIINAAVTEAKKLENAGKNPIVMTSPIVRMYFKKLTEDYYQDLIVVSYNEIDSNVELQSIGMVTA